MLEDDIKTDILKSIALKGAIENPTTNPIVYKTSDNDLGLILDRAHGLPRIKPHLVSKFKLLLSQPLSLQSLNPFEIRCALCKRVISYPTWHYSIRYAVNEFHYFVCFNPRSPLNVTANCNRR